LRGGKGRGEKKDLQKVTCKGERKEEDEKFRKRLLKHGSELNRMTASPRERKEEFQRVQKDSPQLAKEGKGGRPPCDPGKFRTKRFLRRM